MINNSCESMDQTLKYVLPKIHIKKENDADEKGMDPSELFDGEVTSEEVDDDDSSIEVIDIQEDSDQDEGKETDQNQTGRSSPCTIQRPQFQNGNSTTNDIRNCESECIQIQEVRSLNNSGENDDNGFEEDNKDDEDEIQLVEEVIGPPEDKVKNVPLICKITKVSSTFKCSGIESENIERRDEEEMQVDNDDNNNNADDICNGNSSSNNNENNNWINTDVYSVSSTIASKLTVPKMKIKNKSLLKKKKMEFKKKGKAAFHGPKSKIASYVNAAEIHVPRRGPKKGSFKISQFPPLTREYNEVYDLPFQYGWRREIVYRAAAIEEPKYAHKKMDVYYYTPTGKKLRSLRNIQAYLEKTNDTAVTIDSFTFRRILLSHDSSVEVIRSAHRCPAKLLALKKKTIPANEAVQTDDKPTEPVKKKVKHTKVKETTKEATKMDTSEGINGCAATQTEIDNTNGLCLSAEKSGEEGIPKCSSHCPGQQGVIPSLHCNGCLCLFHPRCVGIMDPYPYLPDFMCKECSGKGVGSEAKNMNDLRSGSEGMSSNEMLQHQPHSTSGAAENLSELKSMLNPVPSGPADQDTLLKMYSASSKSSISVPSTRHYSCGVTIQKVGQPPALHAPTSKPAPLQLDAASISVIPVPHKSVAAPVVVPPVSNPELVSKPILQPNIRFLLPTVAAGSVPQLTSSTAIFNAQQPTITNTYAVSNNTLIPIQLNLPTSTSTLTSYQSIFPIVNSVVRSVPQTPVLTNVTSLKTQLPIIRHDYSRFASQNATSLLKGFNAADSLLRPLAPQQALSASEHAYNKPKVKFRSPTYAAKSRGNLVPGECSMSMLHGGFSGMLRIFHFLSLPDLMRASQVCRTWRNIVSHPLLWQAVNLKNCRVTCWESFAKHMQRYGVKRLDLRGMCLFEDKNRTWHEFVSVLDNLKGLSHLDIGEVPAPIVHTVCNILTQLKGFTAEWIVDGTKDNLNPTSHCRLSVNKLSQMISLETLRIRGVYGLHLPSPDTGLNCLENLTNLKCLSLTSLKDMHLPNFDFLRSWEHLVALELGDCYNWKEETYDSIGHLTSLQKLRLEFGGSTAQKGLVKAIKKLHNLVQLDLILFQIPSEMGEVLSPLTKLKSLSIWPDLSDSPARNNYNTLEALKHVPSLKSFTWGLVTSTLFVNKPGEKFDHQSSCIPFLMRNANSYMLAEVKINAGLLMNKLRASLPSSKVQVMMVPNSSYCTIGYMPR